MWVIRDNGIAEVKGRIQGGDNISATKQKLFYVGRPITEGILDEHGVRTESTLDVNIIDPFAQASKV